MKTNLLFRIGRRAIVALPFIAGLLLLADVGTSAAQTPEGKKLALLVGVNEYRHAKLDKLEFAERDVTELQLLLHQQGYKVELLTAAEGRRDKEKEPTQANIKQRLAQLLDGVTRDDTILVALAGHGLQPERTSESYFCPVDANPTIQPGKEGGASKVERPETLVAITGENGLLNVLDNSGVGRKILLVDACRNDPNSGRGRGTASNITAVPEKTWLLLSCSRQERAFETPKLGNGHGVFFHFVLEGLRGKAAPEQEFVTWNRLSEYVYDQVAKTVPDVIGGGAEQHPQELKNATVPLVLARITKTTIPQPLTPEPLDKPAMKKPKSSEPAPAPSPSTLMTKRTGNAPDLLVAPFDESKAHEAQEAWAKHLGTQVEVTNSIGMKIRLIPAGVFQMRSGDGVSDEKPAGKIQITYSFYMGTYEVTQQEFEKVIGRNPSWFSRTGAYSGDVAGQDTNQFPVENATWYDGVEFCNKLSEKEGLKPYYHLTSIERDDDQSIKSAEVSVNGGNGYRLPTEGEWEYACRAGTTVVFHVGEKNNGKDSNLDGAKPDDAEQKDPNLKRPMKVGSYRPNNFGLCDLLGNIKEWCQDLYDADYYKNSPVSNPVGPDSGKERVLRGDSWATYESLIRFSARHGLSPDFRSAYIGFRVARTL